MKRFLLAAILVLVSLGFGLFVADPALAAVTDCSQLAAYGDMICLDPTTGYGPLVIISTPGSSYWNAFPVTLLNWNVTESGVSHANWSSIAPYGAVTLASYPGGTEYVYVGNFSSSAPVAYTNNATYDSWLAWFGNASTYPTMEFFVVS